MSASFDRLSLRAKLAVTFAMLIGLMLIGISTTMLGQRYVISALDTFLERDGRLAELALDSKVAMGQARRYEKEFLLKVREFGFEETKFRYATLVQMRIASIRENMAIIRSLTDDPESVRRTVLIEERASRYEAGFLKTVDLHGQLGRADTGVMGQFHDFAHHIEALLQQGAPERLMVDLLTLRRNEKDFLLYGTSLYVDAVGVAAARFRQDVARADLPVQRQAELLRLGERYLALFRKYVAVDAEINAGTQAYVEEALKIEPLLEQFHAHARQVAAMAHTAVNTMNVATTRVATVLSLMAILLASLVAGFISRNLQRSMAGSIDFANRLAAGDWKVRLPLATNETRNEFDQLDLALNRMADALEEAHGALERELEERMRAANTLHESEERFRSLVESSSDWIWEVDAKLRFVYSSPNIKTILGYAPEEILGKTPFDLMPPDEAARVAHESACLAAERRSFAALENRNLHKDGHIVMIETSGVPILDADGTLRGYRGVDRDITQRKRAEDALRKTSQRLALHFQQTPLAVIEWDTDFKVVDWNPAAETIFGYAKAQALGRSAMELILPESVKAHVTDIWQALLTSQGGFRSTNENLTQDGRTIICEWYNTPLIDGHGQVIGVTSLAQDVTKQKEAEQRLVSMAYFDDLTGLPNRALFTDRLSQAIAHAERNERLVGMLFMDLDHFKNVNDTLGHATGDRLLQVVATRLKSCLRESDTVARLGGDEFAVVLSGMANVEDAVQVAQKILEAFKKPIAVVDQELFITFSIGITLYPFDDGDVQNLLRNADSAMYQAKALGRNNFQFYSAEMTSRAEKRLHMEIDLRHALEAEQFLLHYQPQLDLRTGQVTGMEALLRWQYPERGLVSPPEFISVAEDTGLILPIGEWVLRTACTQAKAWQKQGLPKLVMAVNLSARQFKQGELVQLVTTVLEETGLAPQYLELEVTESLLIDGADSTVVATLKALKGLGITLSIDDFGTGYASLSYLKRFPIDKLKIDQSFVRDIASDPDDVALVRAIIAMARSLRLTVIAEGVETADQLDWLRRHDCDQMQGYYFSRPVPTDEFAALIVAGKALPEAES